MTVVGIDPGLANTGFGVIATEPGRLRLLDGGVVATERGRPLALRLVALARATGALLDRYRPDALAFEDLYFGRNARTAFAVGQARGVVMLVAGERNIPCFSYTPQQVKGAVCGSGQASKEQVARMVARLLAMPALDCPDHATDALAAAICHANGEPLRVALAAERGVLR